MPEYSIQLFRHLPGTPRQNPNLFVGTFQDFILPLFRQDPFGKHPVDILLGYLAIFLAALENQLADVSNLDDVHFSLPGRESNITPYREGARSF